ncbi:MAG: hypothetical protein AAGI45_18670 [Cyanobacteria bacterium P01_H01_bin.26]
MTLSKFYPEQHYTSAVIAAVADLLHSYRGYQIDVIRPLPSHKHNVRAYQLWITAWDKNEDRYEFIYKLHLGLVEGEPIVLSWMPL